MTGVPKSDEHRAALAKSVRRAWAEGRRVSPVAALRNDNAELRAAVAALNVRIDRLEAGARERGL